MKKKSNKKSNKPFHLIIEGSDKVGKTTVCQILSKRLKLPIIKMQDMPRFFKVNPEEASEIFNKTISQFSNYSFILDRGFPSSLVYSIYYNRRYDLAYLEEVKTKLKPEIFVLSVKPRAEDDLVSLEDQNELRKIYSTLAKVHNWTEIDCTNLTPIQISTKILKHVNVT